MQAADYVGEDNDFGDDELMLVKVLRVSCWLNVAACNLKLNDFKEAINLCSKVKCKKSPMRSTDSHMFCVPIFC